MSTVRADNWETAGGAQSVDHNAFAKMWANYTSVTTTATNDSYNVTSVTDNGTGDTDLNLTNDMADTNYGQLVSTGSSSGAANINAINLASTDKLVGAARCAQGNPSNAAAVDSPNGTCALYGDLA
jgi:hypothetical protein